MCETCKNGIAPTKWSDVEGKSGIISLACPDCGKLFYGEVVPPREAAQQGVQLTAFGARLAWLFFGFILLLAMVLIIIGGN